MKNAIYLLQWTAGGLEQANKMCWIEQQKCLWKIEGKTNKPNYHDGYGPAKLGHSWNYENYKIYIYYIYVCVF